MTTLEDVLGAISNCLFVGTRGEPMFKYRCCHQQHPRELGGKGRVPLI